MLIAADNEAQFLEIFSQSIIEGGEDYLINDGNADGVFATEDSGRSFITTYTLEASVNELDVIKYDGDHLFIAPSRSMDCCFVIEEFSQVTTD